MAKFIEFTRMRSSVTTDTHTKMTVNIDQVVSITPEYRDYGTRMVCTSGIFLLEEKYEVVAKMLRGKGNTLNE